jgi:hypothetical protein
MRRIIAIGGLALALSGCQSFRNAWNTVAGPEQPEKMEAADRANESYQNQMPSRSDINHDRAQLDATYFRH